MKNQSLPSPFNCEEFIAYDPEIFLVIGRRSEIESFQSHEKFEDWSFVLTNEPEYENIRPISFDGLLANLSANTWHENKLIEVVNCADQQL